ncbi:MAG: iron-containing alcohol dehydrogenase [Luteitalea sp.]|nr:iron-containing alcohol dehydrogenase [Luteitalea sp.]
MRPFDFIPRTRVVFGAGALGRVGELAHGIGSRRALLVADPGIVATGFVDRAITILRDSRVEAFLFDRFSANPDAAMVERGRAEAGRLGVDSIVALGGGSSLDCAKGINFVLTNGGVMSDYRGYGKALRPLLPSIGVPTTAGTGSEAQSYAIISDTFTHEKMACGDPKAAFQVAVLDPELTVTQPRTLTAACGFDAISHAVESYVTSGRTDLSDGFARAAWRLLVEHFERVLSVPDDLEARGSMLLGAHEAGVAIEQSMLGAAHACANPLTARFGTTHGVAIAVMLPHVVRWNGAKVGDRYAELLRISGEAVGADAGEQLAQCLERLARIGGLTATLRDLGAARSDLGALASNAASQWTGTFNPRPFDAAAALALYERAYQ